MYEILFEGHGIPVSNGITDVIIGGRAILSIHSSRAALSILKGSGRGATIFIRLDALTTAGAATRPTRPARNRRLGRINVTVEDLCKKPYKKHRDLHAEYY